MLQIFLVLLMYTFQIAFQKLKNKFAVVAETGQQFLKIDDFGLVHGNPSTVVLGLVEKAADRRLPPRAYQKIFRIAFFTVSKLISASKRSFADPWAFRPRRPLAGG